MPSNNNGVAVTITAVDAASKKIDAINKNIAAMRAPVDRVTKSIVKFGDTTGITALSKGMRSVAAQSLEAFQNVSRLAGPMGAITSAASVAGMAGLAVEWARFNSQLAFSAQRSGMSAGRLSDLSGAAQLAGSSAQALTAGMIALNDNLHAAAAGRSPTAMMALAFLGLGNSVRDSTGHLKTASDMLPEIADRIAAQKDPWIQAQLAADLFGGAAEDLLPTLRLGAAALAENVRIAHEYNTITPEMTAAAQRLRTAQTELGQSVSGVANKIAFDLEPILTPLLHDLAEWTHANPEIVGGIGAVGGAVTGLIASLGLLRTAWLAMRWVVPASAAPAVAAAARTATSVAGAIATGVAGGASGAAGVALPIGAGVAAAGVGAYAADKASQANLSTAQRAAAQGFTVVTTMDENGLATEWKNPATGKRISAYEIDSQPRKPAAAAPVAVAPGGQPAASAQPGQGSAQQAAALIQSFEGFAPKSAWDVNAFRAGYGSDTLTDPRTGAVSPVTANTSGVTREAAQADLNRRVAGEFMPKAANAIGIDAWNNLSSSEQAAITSLTYNYGRVPESVVAAARSGSAVAIGGAIEGLAGANNGVNAGRRQREAQIAMGPSTAGIAGGTGVSSETKLTGGATLDINLGSGFPPGTTTSANATGNIWAAPPRVEQAMNLGSSR